MQIFTSTLSGIYRTGGVNPPPTVDRKKMRPILEYSAPCNINPLTPENAEFY